MLLSELLKNIMVPERDIEITGITNDSRNVKEGFLFVAERGFETDGHRFIPAAIKNGAAAILCEEDREEPVPCFKINNTRRAMSVAAANWYGSPARSMTFIGVTGTNGKTTTTGLIKEIIERVTGKKAGLIGTNRNMIGSVELSAERTTPDSLELQQLLRKMADAGCEYVVMEVSSHALFLDRVYGLRFKVGVFTNLTEDHLDFHKTMDAYANAKSILFENSEISLINTDDPYSDVMRRAAAGKVYTYAIGNRESADFAAENVSLNCDSVSFNVRGVRAKLGIPGKFSVYNALAALGAVNALGIEFETACNALALCHSVKGRAEVVPTGRDFSVIIDYAHSPDALNSILDTVRGFAEGRIILVFGCGGDREHEKRPIMGRIAADKADIAIVTSDNPRTEKPMSIIDEIVTGIPENSKAEIVVIENRKDAIYHALRIAEKGDVVLLAGKGHEDYQIIGHEKNHFDEREVVRESLEKLSGTSELIS